MGCNARKTNKQINTTLDEFSFSRLQFYNRLDIYCFVDVFTINSVYSCHLVVLSQFRSSFDWYRLMVLSWINKMTKLLFKQISVNWKGYNYKTMECDFGFIFEWREQHCSLLINCHLIWYCASHSHTTTAETFSVHLYSAVSYKITKRNTGNTRHNCHLLFTHTGLHTPLKEKFPSKLEVSTTVLHVTSLSPATSRCLHLPPPILTHSLP